MSEYAAQVGDADGGIVTVSATPGEGVIALRVEYEGGFTVSHLTADEASLLADNIDTARVLARDGQ